MKIDSRRTFFKFVVVTAGVATLGVNEALAKATKAQSDYVETPKNGEKCSNCFHFEQKSSTCGVVEGKVLPQAWCKFYLAKDVEKRK
jgi:hypothetical protein